MPLSDPETIRAINLDNSFTARTPPTIKTPLSIKRASLLKFSQCFLDNGYIIAFIPYKARTGVYRALSMLWGAYTITTLTGAYGVVGRSCAVLEVVQLLSAVHM